MRLIDADELLNKFESSLWYDSDDRDIIAKSLLDESPTINAIVLPCKEGYTLFTESWVKGYVSSFEAPDVKWIIENTKLFGKTVFLTREQAEAALKESEDKHYKSLNMDILKSKPLKIVSTEEALRDVEPLFTGYLTLKVD